MDNLPEEIIVQIAIFCNLFELCKLTQLSKRYRRICNKILQQKECDSILEETKEALHFRFCYRKDFTNGHSEIVLFGNFRFDDTILNNYRIYSCSNSYLRYPWIFNRLQPENFTRMGEFLVERVMLNKSTLNHEFIRYFLETLYKNGYFRILSSFQSI